MKTLRIMLALLMVCLCSVSLAETSYTYGGSDFDCLYEAAVSPDGRIVLTGETASSDGTLATRTKSSRAAWALCIDLDGQPLWSFCTRYGSTDSLHYPVFHQDGSVTMLLDTSHDGLYEVEWLRLDENGEVLARNILTSKGTPYLICSYGVSPEPQGYVVLEANKKTSAQRYLLYSFDGEPMGEIPAPESAYFPPAVLPSGEVVTIQNSDEPPIDVTVTFAKPLP